MDLAHLINRRKWLLYHSSEDHQQYYWRKATKEWVKLSTLEANISNAMKFGTTDLVHWPTFPDSNARVVIYEIMEGKQDSHTIRMIPIKDYQKGGY